MSKWFSMGYYNDHHEGAHFHVRIWKIELYVGFSRYDPPAND